MQDILMKFGPVVAAGAFAFVIYLVLERFVFRGPRAAKRLGDFVGGATQASGSQVKYGSREHKIRVAFKAYGMEVAGWEESAVWMGRGVIGAVCVLVLMVGVQLPPMISMVGLLGGLLLMDGLIDGTWDKVRTSIEREIPVFLNGFSSTIQVTQDVLHAVEEEADSLSPNGPLRGWLMQRLVTEGQSRGQECMKELIDEAFTVSSSLGIMVFLINRLWETGGKEWGRAFAMAGSNIEGILDARIMAQSAGEGAKGSVKIIALMTSLVIFSMVRNPSVADAMKMPLMQLVYAGLVLMMLFGWTFMSNMINDAL